MNIILDIFSGNPNPMWIASKQQEREFLQKINKIITTDKIQESDGLGYRGIIVEITNESVEKKFEVNNGVIRTYENKLMQVLEDKDYEIERWLLDTAPRIIDQQLIKYVKEKLNSRIVH